MTIDEAIADLGITRLCHLTPFRNLLHLASNGRGLLSLQQLAEAQGDYDQQDLLRLDGHPDHISCSIEYPNGWYLNQRRLRATPLQKLFPDWVCLSISTRRFASPGTKVCVRNAAAGRGRYLQDLSEESLRSLYAQTISGSRGVARLRTKTRIPACPTDDQAEVLIHRAVPLADIQAVIVASEGQARRHYVALRQIGAQPERFNWVVAPILLTTRELSNAIAEGQRPAERLWSPSDG